MTKETANEAGQAEEIQEQITTALEEPYIAIFDTKNPNIDGIFAVLYNILTEI